MSGVPVVGPRYRILRRLGQGGMAEVFEAELAGELGFARRVAIKRMLGDAAADSRAAHRFLDEARIASRLHHANIVAVTDVGLLDELPFQVLELVDGLNAQQLLQRAGGVLPLEVALAICAEVAHALDHAHAAHDVGGAALGIVHRDVKPSNILVSWSGDVKLADFGIALARDRASRTETGVVSGTLGFMAPEQRTSSEVDGRTDVFALGLTLHAMITGENPLQQLEVELAAIEGRPIPLAPGLPDDVHRLIARAVAPARLDRPSAARLADEIGAALAPRLARDARGAIRDFVEPLSGKRPPVGALDHLLGIEVIPDEPAPGGVPSYHTVAAGGRARADAAVARGDAAAAPAEGGAPAGLAASPAGLVPAGLAAAPAGLAPAGLAAAPAGLAPAGLAPAGLAAALAGPPTEHAPASPVRRLPPASPPRGRRLAVLSIATLALGGGALGVWRLSAGGGAGAPMIAAAPADVAAATLAPAPADTALAPADAISETLVAAPAAPADAAPALPDAAPPRSAAGSRHRPASRPPAPAPEVAPAAAGWLLVYGDDLVGSRVLVDGGKWTGSVPNAIEVAAGRRSVAVVRRDGTRLPAKQVDVTSFHSAVRPLRITW